MKLKKLWAMLLVFALLIPSIMVSADEVYGDIAALDEAISRNGNLIYNFPTTDQLSDTSTTDTSDKRISGKPVENVIYEVVSDYDSVSNSYYEFEEISGSVYIINPTPTYYDEVSVSGYVTAAPTPTAYDELSGSGYVTSTPTPYQNPTATPEVTNKPTPYQNPTATPAVTNKPTPYQNPTTTPAVTNKPTPYQNPVTTPVVRPNPQGVVYVTPVVKTPEKKTFNVDLEVGRLAHIKPEKATNDTKKSSDTSIINDPRLSTSSFNAEYEARANKPGTATLTFYNGKDLFTEEWNVNVYCRPLDFEKTEYVVEKKSGKDGYITLYLKNFEYEYEYAYAFEWSSSDKNVAYIAGATQTTTFARVCVKKPGFTIITVKDKYGNSSQCALIVKDADEAKATPVPTEKPTSTPKPTKTPKPTATPEPTPEVTATPKPTKTPKPTATPTPTPDEEAEWGGLTVKAYKKMIKASSVNLKVTQKTGKLTIKWDPDSETDLVLDGFEIQVKRKGTKKYKTIKTVESGETFTWNYTSGANDKVYVFRVRGYVNFGDTKVYTNWSTPQKARFKKSKK